MKKPILPITVKSARGYTLTENECDTLRDIAAQCPLEGGSAVRTAPYHLPHAEAITYLREEQGTEACEAIERSQIGVLLRGLEITLSPNPANDLITIQLSKAVIDFYSVYDLTGKVLLEKASSAASNKLDIPLNHFPDGIFFLRITDESNRVYTRKFVIAH